MKAEVVLTPTESKKLISEAIYNIPEVQRALRGGILAMHPSSSTVFLYERITGALPNGLWVCGVIADKGLCGSSEAVQMIRSRGAEAHDPLKVSKETWVFDRGKRMPQAPLGEIMDAMGPDDVYIKGVNAVDRDGNAGVLFSNPAGGGGTIGKVMAARQERGFTVLLPAGLEKLIPTSIKEACRAVGFKKTERAMGIPASLFPVSGRVIDEREALKLLFGVEATVIAAGGLGTGGCVAMVLSGEESDVNAAFDYILSIKGTTLPELRLPEIEGNAYPTLAL